MGEAVEVFGALPRSPDRFLAFRGHANLEWSTQPHIARPGLGISDHENAIVRELVALHPGEFLNDRSMFDRLVRMQHFGLPTRLLDVTINPLVALFFATDDDPNNSSADGAVVVFNGPKTRQKYFDSDAVSCIANLANLSAEERQSIEHSKATTVSDFNKLNAVDRLFQFIRAEKPHFRKAIQKTDLFRPYYVIPKMSNKRMIAQTGAFIIYGLNPKRGPRYDRDIAAHKIRVPADRKPRIRAELAHLGIDDSTLFPEIDRAAKQIVQKFVTLR